MKRINSLVCTAAIIVISGLAVSDVYAQSTGGRAFFSYPMSGQTLEQKKLIAPPAMSGRLRRPDTILRLYLQPSERECQTPEPSPMLRGEHRAPTSRQVRWAERGE